MDQRKGLHLQKRPPNPKTRAAHKKEFGKQVLLPFSLFIILSIGICAVLISYNVGTTERWAQIASIFLISLWMLLGIILLALLVGLIYLIGRTLQLIPPYTRLAQDGIETIKRQVETGADITAKPVIKIKSFLAVIDALRGRR